jgi:hypothetical protein
MKKIIRFFLLSALTVGVLSSVQAQRGRDSRGGGGNTHVSRTPSSSRSFSAPQRSMSQRSAPERSFNQRPQSITSQRSVSARTSTNSRNGFIPNNATRNSSRGNAAVITPERNTTAYNTRTIGNRRTTGATSNIYNRTGNVNVNRSYYHYNRNVYVTNRTYHSYHGYVYGHRTVFMYGPHYTIIPRSFISIHFGGYPYYYNNGLFYGYYSGYYQPLFPPFGISIGILPFGYSSLFIGGYPYYYYNGIYYRPNGNNSYQVVDAPMGATVSSLPGVAKSVIINGETLYELNGTYYKSGQDSHGNNAFTVVGKNGVINNTQSQAPDTTPSLSSLNIGDTVGQLPDGSKLININGEQLYETPDDVYLKGESNDGVVQFKVVGK